MKKRPGQKSVKGYCENSTVSDRGLFESYTRWCEYVFELLIIWEHNLLSLFALFGHHSFMSDDDDDVLYCSLFLLLQPVASAHGRMRGGASQIYYLGYTRREIPQYLTWPLTFILIYIVKTQKWRFLGLVVHQKCSLAGLHSDPLGELTALPQPPCWI